MSHRIATDATFNAYCPVTQGRERLMAEDERTSYELAVRCGLKSVRGDAPRPEWPRGVPRKPGSRVRDRRKGG